VPREFESCGGFGLEPVTDGVHLAWFEREAGREPVADAEERVDSPRRRDGPDGQVAPCRELLVDQSADRVGATVSWPGCTEEASPMDSSSASRLSASP
jgi:hypothetical protein